MLVARPTREDQICVSWLCTILLYVLYVDSALLMVVSHRRSYTPLYGVATDYSDTIKKQERQDNSRKPRCFSRSLDSFRLDLICFLPRTHTAGSCMYDFDNDQHSDKPPPPIQSPFPSTSPVQPDALRQAPVCIPPSIIVLAGWCRRNYRVKCTASLRVSQSLSSLRGRIGRDGLGLRGDRPISCFLSVSSTWRHRLLCWRLR